VAAVRKKSAGGLSGKSHENVVEPKAVHLWRHISYDAHAVTDGSASSSGVSRRVPLASGKGRGPDGCLGAGACALGGALAPLGSACAPTGPTSPAPPARLSCVRSSDEQTHSYSYCFVQRRPQHTLCTTALNAQPPGTLLAPHTLAFPRELPFPMIRSSGRTRRR
jgi:hypothetical protein